MGRINVGSVLIGGVLAGAIIFMSQGLLNVVVLGEQMAVVAERYGLPQPSASAFAAYFVISLILGCLAVWVYAAIRPRFGPGARTAMIAGIAAWGLSYGLMIMVDATQGIWPMSGLIIAAIWGLLELILATTLGARFYKEPASG